MLPFYPLTFFETFSLISLGSLGSGYVDQVGLGFAAILITLPSAEIAGVSHQSWPAILTFIFIVFSFSLFFDMGVSCSLPGLEVGWYVAMDYLKLLILPLSLKLGLQVYATKPGFILIIFSFETESFQAALVASNSLYRLG